MPMEKRQAAACVLAHPLLHPIKGRDRIFGKPIQSACLDELGNLALLAGQKITGKLRSLCANFTLRYHDRALLEWRLWVHRTSCADRRSDAADPRFRSASVPRRAPPQGASVY